MAKKPTARGLQVLFIGFASLLTVLVIGKVEIWLIFASLLVGGVVAFIAYYPVFSAVSVLALAPQVFAFYLLIRSFPLRESNPTLFGFIAIIITLYMAVLGTQVSDWIYGKFDDAIDREREQRPTFME